MPELPEVERARARLHALATGSRISRVDANDDTIVFANTTATEFAKAIEGKLIIDVKRRGKNFYLLLESPPHPMFHFGMSGQAFILGERGDSRRRGNRAPITEWPPKYAKVCLKLVDATSGDHLGDWAFCDSRRFGRIQLVHADDPETVPPLSLLGADPLLDMLPLETMTAKLAKRNAPIKAILLDQNGPFCGIGNWMVDEILYHAKLHPAHPASALTADELATLHDKIQYVTNTAVRSNAESSAFPADWLFKKRWGKGKRQDHSFTLPDGTVTRIVFEQVGGRTSAIVEAVQKLPSGTVKPAKTTARKQKTAARRKRADSSEAEGETEAVLDTEGDALDNVVSESEAAVLEEAAIDIRRGAKRVPESSQPEVVATRNVMTDVKPVKRRRKTAQTVVAEVVSVTATSSAVPSIVQELNVSQSPIKQSEAFTLPGVAASERRRSTRVKR
ncbi:hypothetical protein ACM66B_005018 [Microbotryomycetes sp. NB124-2]